MPAAAEQGTDGGVALVLEAACHAPPLSGAPPSVVCFPGIQPHDQRITIGAGNIMSGSTSRPEIRFINASKAFTPVA